MELVDAYAGLPPDVPPPQAVEENPRQSVFEAHIGLFIAMIIIAVICVIVIIIGLIWLKCRKRCGTYKNKDKNKYLKVGVEY